MTTTDALEILEARYGPVPLKHKIWARISFKLSTVPLVGEHAAEIFEILRERFVEDVA